MPALFTHMGSDAEDTEAVLSETVDAPAHLVRRLAPRAAAALCVAGALLGTLGFVAGRHGQAPDSTTALARPEAVVGLQAVAPEHQSVMGGPLSTCSKVGTALTGFTRDGHCLDSGDDDAGSHHICIQMKSDFCTVTGQPNWCVSKMECMGQAGKCPIGNWCVCQWAFASYLQMAGGCDQIVDLVCDATNMAAFHAYEKSNEPSHKVALACIKQKCGIA